jgi:beta-lactamase regulating signal transducer with metallopeptidase domain
MRLSRRICAAIGGAGIGVAGCNDVSSITPPGSTSDQVMRVVPHEAAALLVVLCAAAVLLVMMSIARQGAIHHRMSQRLRVLARPATFHGVAVGVVPADGVAIVAGLFRPALYVSPDVLSMLSREEAMAVLLHERHHQLHHAPMRLVALAGVRSVIGWLPPVARWLQRRYAAIEIAADAHALSRGCRPPVIASALIKLASPAGSAVRRGDLVAGFDSSTDHRLRALLGETSRNAPRWDNDLRVFVGVAAVVLVVCASLPM